MENKQPQLKMIWSEALLTSPPEPKLQAGYTLRIFDPAEDLADYLSLVHEAGFTDFGPPRVERCLNRVLPNGFFVVAYEPTGELVATAMATHNPTTFHPYGGELGWVAGRPAHAGKGLGTAVCAAVVKRLLSAGYERIHLLTDDWRLPALKIYLKLGFVPFLFEQGIAERWEAVCEKLAWPFTPAVWPSAPGN